MKTVRIDSRSTWLGLALVFGPLGGYTLAQAYDECISRHWVNVSQINVSGACAGWTECPGMILCMSPGAFHDNTGVTPTTVGCNDYVNGQLVNGKCVNGTLVGTSMWVTRQVDTCINECDGGGGWW